MSLMSIPRTRHGPLRVARSTGNQLTNRCKNDRRVRSARGRSSDPPAQTRLTHVQTAVRRVAGSCEREDPPSLAPGDLGKQVRGCSKAVEPQTSPWPAAR